MPPRIRVLFAAVFVAGATLAAYANSFNGDFLFDDIHAIVENPHIKKLWPLAHAMSAPAQSSLAGRPIVSLSFALNHAYSGVSERGFHVGNLLIHACAALALFGFLRLALRAARRCESLPPLEVADGAQPPSALFGSVSPPSRTSTPSDHRASPDLLAALIAALWAVHPLQTESVTYLVQRSESLMGMFYLLTLYLSARSFSSASPLQWQAGAVACCALGMGCKESMITVPVMVLLYDWLFASGSFLVAFRRRWLFYTALLSTWLILAAIISGGPRSNTVGFDMRSLTMWGYARSQFGVIVHYLRLSFWPHPLCLDYDWPVARTTLKVLPPAILVLTLAAATVWAIVRRSPLGFVGAGFFITLAPSSSIVPIADLAFEHRMYLPLAAVVAVVVVAGAWMHRWFVRRAGAGSLGWTILASAVAVILLTAEVFGTIRRNRDYNDGLAMWRQVVELRPRNTRARISMGIILAARGEFEEAIQTCRDSLRIDPTDADGAFNVGKALQQAGATGQSMELYQEAIRIDPRHFRSKTNLGEILSRFGRHDEAVEQYRAALADQPGELLPLQNMAMALLAARRDAEAAEAFQKILAATPDDVNAMCDLGTVLARLGRIDEAAAWFDEALRREPRHVACQYAFASALDAAGRLSEAIDAYGGVLAIDPRHADAHCNLGGIFARQGGMEEAKEQYWAALAIDPNHVTALYNLGCAMAAEGRMIDARRRFQEVLRIDPGHEAARRALDATRGSGR